MEIRTGIVPNEIWCNKCKSFTHIVEPDEDGIDYSIEEDYRAREESGLISTQIYKGVETLVRGGIDYRAFDTLKRCLCQRVFYWGRPPKIGASLFEKREWAKNNINDVECGVITAIDVDELVDELILRDVKILGFEPEL